MGSRTASIVPIVLLATLLLLHPPIAQSQPAPPDDQDNRTLYAADQNIFAPESTVITHMRRKAPPLTHCSTVSYKKKQEHPKLGRISETFRLPPRIY